MPTKPNGVYADGRGGWYFKARLPVDAATGQREQVTKRGFHTAAEAGRARRELLKQIETGRIKWTPAGLTVDKLLDLYLDGLEADSALSAKTRYDYRHYANDYVRPHLGSHRVRDVTPEIILSWQRKLAKDGGTKRTKADDGTLLPGRPLAPNTIRLARSPLSGAFKLAVESGMVAVDPTNGVPVLNESAQYQNTGRPSRLGSSCR